MNLVTTLLQNRTQFVTEIRTSDDLKKRIISLTITGAIAFGTYGFIIGLHENILYALASMIKLPCLYLITLAICMPAFFIFDSFIGSKASMLQSMAMALTATCIIGILLVGFAPVTLLFLITNNNDAVFQFLNIIFFTISGLVGVRFFYYTILSDSKEDTLLYNKRRTVVRIWMILYAFVGTQLAWTLRPFFGAASENFVFIREIKGNFYSNLLKIISDIVQ